jgi:hypothetical protein
LKEEIFQECLKRQKESNNKPFWNELASFYGFSSGEKLRCSFKNEKKKRGYFNPDSANFQKDEEEKSSFEQGNDFINVICTSKRMLNKDDIIEQFKIDTDIWEIEKFKVKTSEGYRKDRKVKWEVEDGKVLYGSVDDSGKLLIAPLYHLEVRFIKKLRVEKARDAVAIMLEDAKKFAPIYPKISYKNYIDGCLYEIAIPDIHFGRLAWEEESGADFDIKIARQCVDSVIKQLLSYASKYNIDKILLPIGNDFFNSDNNLDTTTRGTFQDEDTRWQKTFRKGREMAVSMIDECTSIAPVDVLVIAGNHDQQRSFYLGEALDAWYHHNEMLQLIILQRYENIMDLEKI